MTDVVCLAGARSVSAGHWNELLADPDGERANTVQAFLRTMEEKGLADYLVLLSLYATCEYRGVSFLDFLLAIL